MKPDQLKHLRNLLADAGAPEPYELITPLDVRLEWPVGEFLGVKVVASRLCPPDHFYLRTSADAARR